MRDRRDGINIRWPRYPRRPNIKIHLRAPRIPERLLMAFKHGPINMYKRDTRPFRLLDLPPELLLLIMDNIMNIKDVYSLLFVNKLVSQIALNSLYHPAVAPGPTLRFNVGCNDGYDSSLVSDTSWHFHFHGPCCRGEQGYDPLAKHSCGTLLHWAARTGELRAAVYAHERTAIGTRCRDSFGMLPIHRAVQYGNPAVVEYLLRADSGATIDDASSSCIGPLQLYDSPTAMFVAQGLTPALTAVHYNQVEALRVLYAAGANLDICATRWDSGGGKISALHIAVLNGHGNIVRVLLEYGVDVEGGGSAVWKYTPLHVAVLNGNPEIVELLLSHGARVDTDDPTGRRPLYIAAEAGQAKIVELLLAVGADPLTVGSYNFRKSHQSASVTPLHLAAIKGHTEVIQILAEHEKFDANITTVPSTADQLFLNDATPLHFASQFRHPACVKLLVQLGANIEAKDWFGRTPLCYGAFSGAVECVAALINCGAKTWNDLTCQWLAVEMASANGWCRLCGNDDGSRAELMQLLWDTVPKKRRKDWWENEFLGLRLRCSKLIVTS